MIHYAEQHWNSVALPGIDYDLIVANFTQTGIDTST